MLRCPKCHSDEYFYSKAIYTVYWDHNEREVENEFLDDYDRYLVCEKCKYIADVDEFRINKEDSV